MGRDNQTAMTKPEFFIDVICRHTICYELRKPMRIFWQNI
jgi:hypothetical protein